MADSYDGPVGFGSDGVHYPLDADGHLDTTRPLRWVEGATYRDAEADEQLHNDTHHVREAAVDPSTIVLHDPGRDIYPVGAHVVSDDGEAYYLADEQGQKMGVPLSWHSATQTFRAEGT